VEAVAIIREQVKNRDGSGDDEEECYVCTGDLRRGAGARRAEQLGFAGLQGAASRDRNEGPVKNLPVYMKLYADFLTWFRNRSYFSEDSPFCFRSRGEGTRTQSMPAAVADWIPKSVSSKTRQCAGAMPRRSAAVRKASGAGLLRV
jgi:hypothetical protein